MSTINGARGHVSCSTVRVYVTLKNYKPLWNEPDQAPNHDGAIRILEQTHDSATRAWNKPYNWFLEKRKTSYE